MTEIVAEISGNHGGSYANACRLIKEAGIAGADTVKFQCFTPEVLAAKRGSNPEVLKLAGGVPLVDLYRKTCTPREWFPGLIQNAKWIGLNWFSSVFDPGDVRFLETLDCPRYKISAFEMLDWELIKAVKETGKPIVMSVRSTDNCTVLEATPYKGPYKPLGISDHSKVHDIWANTPMVEYHLKLPDVETPDSDFSLTPEQLRARVQDIRSRAAA